MKRIFTILLIFILIIAAVVVGGYLWYNDAVYVAGGNEVAVRIEVQEGENLLAIAPMLQESGLLKSVEALRIYQFLEKPELNLQVGTYDVPRNLNVPDLITHLRKGPIITTITVTIPEGLRYDEIASILDKGFKELKEPAFSKQQYLDIAANPRQYEFLTEVQQFLDKYKPRKKPLEGFLFPDTYTLANDATSLDIINLQIQTLISRLEENNLNPEKTKKLDSFYDVLTLATITEREANNLKDMRLVADIFIRRLKSNLVLGADAPLLYPVKDWSHALTQAEIENLSNPYNTRKLLGLPPTPISNPGVTAINAVLNPKANTYLYFVSAGGKNYYAETFDGHCQNVQEYLGGSC